MMSKSLKRLRKAQSFMESNHPESFLSNPVEAELLMAKSLKAKSPAEKFHCFKNLPAELRISIWKHAFPGPRIVPLITDEDSSCQKKSAAGYNRSYKAVANSCKEAWLLFKECHEYSLLSAYQPRSDMELRNCLHPGSYFDFERDTALVDLRSVFRQFHRFHLGAANAMVLERIISHLKDVHRLAFDIPMYEMSGHQFRMALTMFGLIQIYCPNMEEVSRIWSAPGVAYKPGYEYDLIGTQHTPGRDSSILYQSDLAFESISILGKFDVADAWRDQWNQWIPAAQQITGLNFQPLNWSFVDKFLVRRSRASRTWQISLELQTDTDVAHSHWEPIDVVNGELRPIHSPRMKDLCVSCKEQCFRHRSEE